MTSDDLAHAVYQTVRYGNIFDQPVTATNIWRALTIPTLQQEHTGQRWGGQRAPHLHDVYAALVQLVAAGTVETEQGYYFLSGRDELVARRQQRYWLAQDKWKRTRLVTRWLTVMPFVRMLAMSGSLAVANTSASSDLDIFVVVASGRIWTARLLLLLTTQLLGVRRKHWDDHAPNKVCLNHYITTDALAIPPEIRNIYTAMLYQHLIPVYGLATAQQFQQANASWIKRQLMFVEAPLVPSVHMVSPGRLGRRIKRLAEHILQEPLVAWTESAAEYLQRRIIAKHTQLDQPGRVALSATELAFHPHTKVPAILARFAQDEGQHRLL